MHPTPRSFRGFTLLELLVVIALIAILASMLLPALSKVKARSLTAVCASNMKQWSLAQVTYLADNDDTIPYSPADPAYRFTVDMTGDGMPDSFDRYPGRPFNGARPTVHQNGANVALLDGHVERIAFKKLWDFRDNRMTHSFWHLED